MGKHTTKKVDRYTIYLEKTLGEGVYGKVYEAMDNKENQVRAIKVVAKQKIVGNQYMEHAIKQEYSIMRKVNSDYTVRCYEMLETPSNYYIVSELCNNGNFRAKLSEQPNGYSAEQAFVWTVKLLKCFMVLAEKGILHRDLKPQNILINNQDLKLCDFGFARISQHSNIFKTGAGTPVYMSPQILRGQSYTEKSDIWSLGIVIYEILYGKRPVPFPGTFKILRDWYYKNEIQYPQTSSQNVELHRQLVEFMRNCLKVREEDRYNWKEVYDHRLFKQYFQYNEKMQVGFIFTRLRIVIHSENIDVSSLMKEVCRQPLNFDDFFLFMQVLKGDVTPREVRYLMQIYGQIDIEKEEQIIWVANLAEPFRQAFIRLQSLDFEDVYRQNNMIESKRLLQQHKQVEKISGDVWSFEQTPQHNPETRPKPTIKCCASIRKLRDSIIASNIDIIEFFQYERKLYIRQNLTQFNLGEFHKFLLKINPHFQEDQSKRVFLLFDMKNKGELSIDQIQKTMCLISGKPYRSHLLTQSAIKRSGRA